MVKDGAKMRTLITFLLISLYSTVALTADRFMEAPFVKVIDGDTIQTMFTSLPYPLSNVKIRILGIDTPEKGYLAKCEQEKILGLAATVKLAELMGTTPTMQLKNFKYDKYGGRVLAYVLVDGVDVGARMIDLELARPYDGGKKSDWCK